MNIPVRVLFVDDSESDTQLALRALLRGGFLTVHARVENAKELKYALLGETWDAVVADFKMPNFFSGMDALKILKATGLDIPFILLSGAVGEETAVEVMKSGASDYVMKRNLARLAPALKRQLD